MPAKIRHLRNTNDHGIWGPKVPDFIKSLIAILLTIVAIGVVYYFVQPPSIVEWYIPIISAIILTVADGSKPMLHPLTRILTFLAAAFYLVVAFLLVLYFHNSYIAGVLFAIIACIIIFTNAYEKKVFGPPGH